MRSTTAILLVPALALGVLAAAEALAKDKGKGGPKQIRYVGIHPLGKDKGLCHIEVEHVHVVAPVRPLEYRVEGDAHVFVGDPVAYGWDGDRISYAGPHPIQVDVAVELDAAAPVTEFCYLSDAHFHAFAPAPTLVADFRLEGDAYFYVGEPAPAFVEAYPTMVKVNAHYTPLAYARPVVVVEPPSGWIGVRFGLGIGARGRGRGQGQVGAGLVVDVPSVEIRPPSFGVDVSIGVGVGVGGAVVVGGGGKVPPGHRAKRGKGGRGKGR